MVRGWNRMPACRVALLGPRPLLGGTTQRSIHRHGLIWVDALGTTPRSAPPFFTGCVGQIWLGRRRMSRCLAPWMAFHAYTPNPNPFLDAGIFTFSLVATYGQAQRCMDNWWAWMGINTAMVALCLLRDMPIYAVYSALMAGLSWKGWMNWKNEDLAQADT